MDPVAVKITLFTVGLIVVLSSLLVLTLRLVRRGRPSNLQRTLPVSLVVALLGLMLALVYGYFFQPWLAVLLIVGAFLSSGVCFFRMPREARRAFFTILLQSPAGGFRYTRALLLTVMLAVFSLFVVDLVGKLNGAAA